MRKHIAMLFFLIFIASCQKKKPEGVVSESAFASQTKPTPTNVVSPTTVITPTLAVTPTLGLEIGDIAYDLNLKDTGNVFLSLYSIKNKLILVDFWATWCKPCRVENNNLKNVYSKYKDTTFKNCKGFEIYSISVDDIKYRKYWIACIINNKYTWKYNVTDDGGGAIWRYNVKSYPTNFLIDEKGIIIAKNLRDTMVEKTLIGLIKSL